MRVSDSEHSIRFPGGSATVVVNPYQSDPPTGKGLMVAGTWHPDLTRFVHANRDITALYCNESRGWSGDFAFLRDTPHIEELYLLAARSKGLEAVGTLTRLRRLSLDTHTSSRIEFSRLGNLRRAYLKWTPHFADILTLPNLTDLSIQSLSADQFSLISQARALRVLRLNTCRTKSIAALTSLNVEELELAYFQDLQDFSPVGHIKPLKRLWISQAPHLRRLDFLSHLDHLEVLSLDGCRSISSLAPLRNLKTLKAVAFTGRRTTILDGDLSPLTELPLLAMVAFAPRRHYTHRAIRPWDWRNIDHPEMCLVKK